MSQIVRQSNLFAGEDFTKVYKSFQEIDFTAYDFDTIKLALVEYVRIQYPEDFNDYIESSEFVAIIELLAYLGTSLAFRVDLNSRENIMDTAQRRESIIRLARLINYQPKRNIATTGLFKVNYLRTDQLLTDSAGNSLANVPVFWADPNNPDWFDQFVTVLNNALNPTNPFGRPSKSGTIGGINTDLYEMNNVLGLNVTQPITVTVNGESIPIDVVNATFVDNETFYEKDPNPQDPFGLIYRNDTLGVGSADTGFFLYFKQGKLEKQDYAYEFPVPNRVQDIEVDNINQRDVYVQEINDQGEVLVQWEKVPSVAGTNVIYNSINFQERNIFEVISELNDQIAVKFADGNFGNTPTGIYRYWYRKSAGRNVVIRPEDASNLQFTIPYNGTDGQTYSLSVNFSLENTVGNGAAAETNEQIKLRAPQTFYTQERMINNEDYNVFPLVFGNEITKVRAINRTYAGHSRYIDINDPTGYHTNITLLGEDGALYNDNEEQRSLVSITNNDIGNVEDEILLQLQQFATNPELENFYANNYITIFKNAFGQDYFELPPGIYWKTAPDKAKNDTGYFIASLDIFDPDWPLGSGYSNVIATTTPYEYLNAGATTIFRDPTNNDNLTQSTLIKSVLNNGKPVNPSVSSVGSIELSTDIYDLWPAIQSTPGFNSLFTEAIIEEIRVKLNERQDFGLGYDLINNTWYIINGANPSGDFSILTSGSQIDRSNVNGWLITVDYQAGDGQTDPSFELISRGTVTVFESLQQVRFYWDPDQKVFDTVTGTALQDEIQLLPNINTTAEGIPLTKTLSWTLSGVFIQDDGYQDPTKVEVVPADLNEDGAADSPNAFTIMVGQDDEVVFERYTNIDGYETSRPWITGWADQLVTVPSQDLELYGLETPNASLLDMGFEGQVQAPPVPSVRVSLQNAGLFEFDATVGPDTVDGVPVPATISRIASLLQQYLNWTGANLVTVRENAKLFITAMQEKTLRGGLVGTNILGKNYWNVQIFEDQAGQLTLVEPVLDENHWGRNGISFEQDTNVGIPYSKQLTYKWKHYAPGSQRVDPSVSNIIDIVVLTDLYYNEVLVWKDSYGPITSFPAPPTTEQLRIEFAELNKYKSISDELIYNSGEFKILFGPQAEAELRATFKAVKIPTASISDNELKTRIIQAIDEYFDINNWDFGERFFYTELAAYIHVQLSKFLHSIVIVPEKEESQFGNLFEIIANPNQLFISTATVDNVIIVKNYTETNLRV